MESFSRSFFQKEKKRHHFDYENDKNSLSSISVDLVMRLSEVDQNEFS